MKCSAHGFLLFISLLLTILHTACGRTTGNGIIISSLVGTECEFDSSADQVFDIGFFAATIFDADGPRRLSLLNNVKRGDSSSMSIRLQASSTTIEYADGILLELSNLEQLGKVFREDTAVIVDSANRCPQCQPPIVPLARASVSIGPLCGGFNETLQSFPITADTSIEQFEEDDGGSSDDKSCEAVDIPSTYTGNCSLNENSRSRLDQICAKVGGLSEVSQSDGVGGPDEIGVLDASVLGSIWDRGESCLYLCEYGDFERGSEAEDDSAILRYGDWLSGVMVIHVSDMQQLIFSGCSRNYGTVMSAFRYRLRRSRTGQPFS